MIRWPLPIEVRHIILILLSCFSGFIIGYERKSKYKQAGRKTHILVALTATLMMILSKEAFLDTPNYDNSRVAAQIVSGISFIGGGIIFMRDKKNQWYHHSSWYLGNCRYWNGDWSRFCFSRLIL